MYTSLIIGKNLVLIKDLSMELLPKGFDIKVGIDKSMVDKFIRDGYVPQIVIIIEDTDIDVKWFTEQLLEEVYGVYFVYIVRDQSKLRELMEYKPLGVFFITTPAYEIASSIEKSIGLLGLESKDRRLHIRIQVPAGSGYVYISIPSLNKYIMGVLYDISAGGIGAVFRGEDLNYLVIGNSYNSVIKVDNVSINTPLVLVNRRENIAGFKFFGIELGELRKVCEYIYKHYIEPEILKHELYS